MAVVDDLDGFAAMNDCLESVPFTMRIGVWFGVRVAGEDSAVPEGRGITRYATLGLGQVIFSAFFDEGGAEGAELARQPDAAGGVRFHVDLDGLRPVVLHALGVEVDMGHQTRVHRPALGAPAIVDFYMIITVRHLGDDQAVGAFADVDLFRLSDKNILAVHVIDVALAAEVDAEIIEFTTVERLPVVLGRAGVLFRR